MSGFLQRLALSVLNPGSAIQPITGSIYSPPKPAASQMDIRLDSAHPRTADNPAEPETLQRPRDIPPRATRDPVFDDLPEKTAPRHTSTGLDYQKAAAPPPTPLSSGPVGGERMESPLAQRAETYAQVAGPLHAHLMEKAPSPTAVLRPALEKRAALSSSPAEGSGDRAGRIAPQTGQPPSLHSTPGRPPAAKLAEHPIQPIIRSFTPLHPPNSGDQANRESPEAHRETTALVPGEQTLQNRKEIQEVPPFKPRPTGPDAAQQQNSTHLDVERAPRRADLAPLKRERTAPPRAGSDDIQIHIGRIEVVATPPARPAPSKPRRGASSLAEYLRQRDGKAA
jgi:hypothetical protein